MLKNFHSQEEIIFQAERALQQINTPIQSLLQWRGENKENLFHLISAHNKVSLLKQLIKSCDNERSQLTINAVNSLKQTPLHLAAKEGYLQIVQTLLSYGANASLRDSMERQPLLVALLEADRHVEKWLYLKTAKLKENSNKIDKIITNLHPYIQIISSLSTHTFVLDNEFDRSCWTRWLKNFFAASARQIDLKKNFQTTEVTEEEKGLFGSWIEWYSPKENSESENDLRLDVQINTMDSYLNSIIESTAMRYPFIIEDYISKCSDREIKFTQSLKVVCDLLQQENFDYSCLPDELLVDYFVQMLEVNFLTLSWRYSEVTKHLEILCNKYSEAGEVNVAGIRSVLSMLQDSGEQIQKLQKDWVNYRSGFDIDAFLDKIDQHIIKQRSNEIDLNITTESSPQKNTIQYFSKLQRYAMSKGVKVDLDLSRCSDEVSFREYKYYFFGIMSNLFEMDIVNIQNIKTSYLNFDLVHDDLKDSLSRNMPLKLKDQISDVYTRLNCLGQSNIFDNNGFQLVGMQNAYMFNDYQGNMANEGNLLQDNIEIEAFEVVRMPSDSSDDGFVQVSELC
ncbi:MAG: hypothetical protein DGJ47_000260 [Rickettsiaceae bacterium]